MICLAEFKTRRKKKEEKGSDDDDDDDSDSEQSYEDDNDLNKELILENDQKKNRLIFQTADSSLSKKASMWFSQDAFKDFDDEFSAKPTQSNLDDSDIEEEPERPWKIPLQKKDDFSKNVATSSSKKRGIAQVDNDDSSDEETIKKKKKRKLKKTPLKKFQKTTLIEQLKTWMKTKNLSQWQLEI